MDTLRWLLGKAPAQRPTVETDDVYPVHFFDEISSYKTMVLCYTTRFDDVLDADKLSGSLCRLLEMGDWRKLGGRLRLAPDGNLTVHVPREFTPERPAVRCSHQVFDTAIAEHPLGSQLPEKPAPDAGAGEKPTAFSPERTAVLASLRARPGCPVQLSDYLASDEPQLALHVASFTDATLVSLSWPHSTTGAMGLADLVAAWGLVLAGREGEVPPFAGAREDVLESAGRLDDPDAEPFVAQHRRLAGLGFVRFAFNMVWHGVFGRPMATRAIHIPGAFVSKLRDRAMADLASTAGGDKQSGVPFISEADVLAAWAARLSAVSAPSRPLSALVAADVRARLPSVFRPPSEAAYVQNTAFAFWSLLPAGFASSPLAANALQFRRDLIAQILSGPGQIHAQLRNVRAAGRGAMPPPYVDPASLLFVVSDWTKAKFSDIVDFSPAVVSSPGAAKNPEHKPGKMTYHHSQLLRDRGGLRHVLNVLGKDQQGDYWAVGIFPEEVWEQLEREVAV